MSAPTARDTGDGRLRVSPVSTPAQQDISMTPHSEILFIDPAVDDIGTLLNGLRPEVKAFVLDPARPAARQMARLLEGRGKLDAVHVIAHGAPGRISFGGGDWTTDTLENEAEDLGRIGLALAEGGGLRLWSCYAGAGDEGQAFVEGMRLAAGATGGGVSISRFSWRSTGW